MTFPSSDYRTAYKAMLCALQENAADAKEYLTAFFPMVGANYKAGESGALLVVGRAVNGWEDDKEYWWRAGDFCENVVCKAAKQAEASSRQGGGSPMSWVYAPKKGDYNANRSAFWRVTKQVLTAVTTDEEFCEDSWAEFLAWSQLFKVAPACGDNPWGSVREAQLDHSRSLLRMEVDLLQPRIVLLLTGWEEWAADLLDDLDLEADGGPRTSKQDLVEWSGRSKGGETRWIVCKHPQGKDEGRMVEAIKGAALFLGAPG